MQINNTLFKLFDKDEEGVVFREFLIKICTVVAMVMAEDLVGMKNHYKVECCLDLVEDKEAFRIVIEKATDTTDSVMESFVHMFEFKYLEKIYENEKIIIN